MKSSFLILSGDQWRTHGRRLRLLQEEAGGRVYRNVGGSRAVPKTQLIDQYTTPLSVRESFAEGLRQSFTADFSVARDSSTSRARASWIGLSME